MAFLDKFRFSGHGQDGWHRDGEKAQFFGANINEYGGASKNKAYKDDWDVERAVTHGNDRVTWVFKSVFAIAANAARLRVYIEDEDGEEQGGHSLLPLLNRKANDYHDAYNFRFQLSSQILLSKRGAFIEVVRNRLDEVTALYLLPPQNTYPIPDPKKFVSGFKVEMPYGQTDRIIPAENVEWIRIPHPIDPYRGQSPLESCGLATEIDYFSRVYNRNFMINDGRPGGILMVKGDMDDDTAEELRRRFLGSTGSALGGAGRLTVMEAEHAAYFDTSTTNRDSQYSESKHLAKQEILMAFGVPESVIGNASDRTFANADTELEVFWRETMLPHLILIERSLDRLDGSEELTVKFDVSDVAILSRDERERATFHLDELKAGGISIDEYRSLTGRDPVGADHLWVQGNLMLAGATGKTAVVSRPLVVEPSGGNGSAPPEPGPPVTDPVAPANSGPVAIGTPVGAVVPSGFPGPVPVRAAMPDDEVKENDPRPLSETKWGFPFGETWVDSKEADLIRLRRDQQLERLEKSVGIQMTAFFQRQRRVVLEKWKSRKIREKVNKGHTVVVGEVFDTPTWDGQLTADARAFLAAAVVDGGNEVALMVGKELDAEDGLVAAAILAGVERIKEVNATTRRQLEKAIAGGLSKGASVDDIAVDIEGVFSKAVKSRSPLTARTAVSFAVNEGQLIAATQSGLTHKVWLSMQDEKVRHSHTDADGQARPVRDFFVVGGSLMMHPGAPTAPITETANCRCTMLFTSKPVVGSLLEFDIPTDDLQRVRAGNSIGRAVAAGFGLAVAATTGNELG